MSELLKSLPKKEDLAAALPQDFKAEGFDTLGGDISSLKEGIGKEIPSDLGNIELTKTVPAGLSSEIVSGKIKDTIAPMSSITAANISKSIKNSPLPIDKPSPMSFDINSQMSAISSALTPNAQVKTPSVDKNIPGFDSNEALFQLQKLAAAGKSMPMKVVGMYLKLFNTFVDTVTDKDKVTQLAIESLEEIYLGQIEKLEYNLPVAVLQDISNLLQTDLLKNYEDLLNDIESSDTPDINLLKRANEEIIPFLLKAKHANQTLINFAASDVAALQKAIDNVLQFTGEGDVVLQQFFDTFEAKVVSVLGAIKTPIVEIKNAADTITKYLEDTAKRAKEAATKVSETITEKLSDIDKFLSGDLKSKIEEISNQINDFLNQVGDQTDNVITSAKGGISSVTNTVESFFEKIEELKEKLEQAVDNLSKQADGKTTEAFEAAEQKIRGLLNKITEILESPSVNEALSKTKEGIEKFKKVMEDVSLQPVFDIVVSKTGEIEIKVEAIKVDELGVPQKTALKLGSKIIKQVKIDEIVKPELISIFKELRDPIAALIKELEQGVLQINHLIDEFAPGTIVRDLLENAGPYKSFIQILETYKPSVLLQPIKDVNTKLTEIVSKLDPNILINKLQSLFDELYTLAEVLSPAKLNAIIIDATNTVTKELDSIQKEKLDQIFKSIKETISLKKLLEGTGIEDIADAEIWSLMKYYLGGDFLDKISSTLSYVEKEIKGKVSTFNFDHHTSVVNQMISLVDQQVKCSPTLLTAALNNTKEAVNLQIATINRLDKKRKQILATQSDVPEYKDILTQLDLQALAEIDKSIDLILSKNDQLSTNLTAFSAPLKTSQSKLNKLDKNALELAAPTFFKRQFSDPVNGIITSIKKELEVFKQAVAAIQKIIETLIKLPSDIDRDVALILDSAAKGIKEVLKSTIEAIKLASSSLTNTVTAIYNALITNLDKFSPYCLLNTFAITDFEKDGALRIRDIIKSPNDEVAIFLNSKILSDHLTLLNADTPNWEKIILETLNNALTDPKLNGKKEFAKSSLTKKIEELKKTADAGTNKLCKYESILYQLDNTPAPSNKHDKTRLNRIILEAMYPDYIEMSLQSLHPFIVAQIGKLYPEDVVLKIDTTYLKIVEKIKGLPKKLIQEPLNDEYNVIKEKFHENFDIEGIFKVLKLKLDGMDEDLELGLNRISFAFNHMIDTLDKRLSQ